jgi:hypothetical protein
VKFQQRKFSERAEFAARERRVEVARVRVQRGSYSKIRTLSYSRLEKISDRVAGVEFSGGQASRAKSSLGRFLRVNFLVETELQVLHICCCIFLNSLWEK